MDETKAFEVERPRLLRLATGVLGERGDAEDVVQQAWLRLHRTDTGIESLPAWLTTVTTGLCLDRLRARVPPLAPAGQDRAAFDGGPAGRLRDRRRLDGRRERGDFLHLLQLFAPDAEATADAAAILAGTPEHIEGRRDVARFFDGSAYAALSVSVSDRPGAARSHRGRAMVASDFMIIDGTVRRIVFRSEPDALSQVIRRDGGAEHHPDRSTARLQHGEGERP